jgi:uncharacterized membrane protein YfcA
MGGLWIVAVACLAGAAGVWWGLGWGLLVAGILLACTALAVLPPRRRTSGKPPVRPVWTSSAPTWTKRGESYYDSTEERE